jgi:outer membrane protein OmpA-like peptidoglycan-associated protein
VAKTRRSHAKDKTQVTRPRTQRLFLCASVTLACLTLALTSSCKRSSGGDAEREAGGGSAGTAARPPAGSRSPSPVAPSGPTSPTAAPTTPSPQAGTDLQSAPTQPANLIAWSAGTVTREWPPSSMDYSTGALPNALIGIDENSSWQSKIGASGPYVFVFEFAAQAEIDSLGFRAYRYTAEAPNAAQAVRVEGSTESPDSGYSPLGEYTLQATADQQNFPLPRPATARWLRVTLQQRRGVEYTSLSHVFAYGRLQPPATTNRLSGVWLYDEVPGNARDQLFQGPGKLTAVPQPTLVDETYLMLQIVQHGSEFSAGPCHTTSVVQRPLRGSQAGARVRWESVLDQDPLKDGVLNAEGNLIVGASRDDRDPYILMRLPAGPDCAHVEKPVGAGQNVLVLTEDGRFMPYPVVDVPAQFPGYRFVPLSIAVFAPEALAGVDTVVMGYICDAGKKLAPWQAQALLDFTQAGHKLIIDDADKCTSTDYGFLPYQFHTSNPGAQGASAHNLILVEPSTLGNDTKNSKQYIDLKSWFSDTNQIGDANTVTTKDPHWCGHLFGTNALNVDGFMHMYAPFGQGLFIYNGFDKDDGGIATYEKLLLLELQQPVPALLACTESVAGKFLIAPSKQVPFASGRAQQILVPLQVLANQGYAGTISLAPKAPPDAPWKTALSVAQVTLKGDVAPVTLTIDVPANAGSSGHQFLVVGNDSVGNAASATITLVATAVPEVAKVESVANGCTRQFTVGSDALFAFAEATLTPTAQKTLNALGPVIRKSGQHPVQIRGYTDSIGSDVYNQLLSEQRARTVRDWLAAHHYIAATTPTQGFGKKDPVAPNTNPNGSDNPAGRAKNRRVEVLIDTCK